MLGLGLGLGLGPTGLGLGLGLSGLDYITEEEIDRPVCILPTYRTSHYDRR